MASNPVKSAILPADPLTVNEPVINASPLNGNVEPTELEISKLVPAWLIVTFGPATKLTNEAV